MTRVDAFRVLLSVSLIGTLACKRTTAAHPQPNLADVTAGQTANAPGAGTSSAPVAGSSTAPNPAPIQNAPPVAGTSASTGTASPASSAGGGAGGGDPQAGSTAGASAGQNGNAGQTSAGRGGADSSAAGQSGAGGQAADGGMGGSESTFGSGGTQGIQPGKRGQPGRCRLPSSCQNIDSWIFTLTACCLEGNECGYELTNPPELRDLIAQMGQAGESGGGFNALAACVPATEIFRREPGEEEKRIPNPGGMDQLITPDCESRALLAFPLPGCCLPSNRCGVSTYQIRSVLQTVAIFPAPFTEIECVTVEELNAQFRQSLFAGAAQLPPSDGTCNYADLNMRLSAAE